MNFETRLSSKVRITGFCWLWTGAKNGSDNRAYGQIWSAGRLILAHRWVYENLVDEIPAGKVLDHLCRVRLCVNPDHLEPVTQQKNLQRGGHSYLGLNPFCIRGHDLREARHQHYPLRGSRKGQLQCRTCIAERNRKRELRKKLEVMM